MNTRIFPKDLLKWQKKLRKRKLSCQNNDIYYSKIFFFYSNRGRELYKMQWERNNADLTLKNKELIEKIHEVDSLKRKYEEALQELPLSYTQTRVSL